MKIKILMVLLFLITQNNSIVAETKYVNYEGSKNQINKVEGQKSVIIRVDVRLMRHSISRQPCIISIKRNKGKSNKPYLNVKQNHSTSPNLLNDRITEKSKTYNVNKMKVGKAYAKCGNKKTRFLVY